MADFRCPECMAQGVTPRRIMGQHSYDEGGRYHPHGPDSPVTQYHCSNGHEWAVDVRDHCAHCAEAPNAER